VPSSGYIEALSRKLLSAAPISWCDLVARAELAAFYAGVRTPTDWPGAFNAKKRHEQAAVDLIRVILELGVKSRPEPSAEATEEPSDARHAGWVYLVQAGNAYKIGRTKYLDQRMPALAIQLPEKLELVHAIKTDDPAGIERYWLGRFAHCRKNGE
jgi:hypothetical protein